MGPKSNRGHPESSEPGGGAMRDFISKVCDEVGEDVLLFGFGDYVSIIFVFKRRRCDAHRSEEIENHSSEIRTARERCSTWTVMISTVHEWIWPAGPPTRLFVSPPRPAPARQAGCGSAP